MERKMLANIFKKWVLWDDSDGDGDDDEKRRKNEVEMNEESKNKKNGEQALITTLCLIF